MKKGTGGKGSERQEGELLAKINKYRLQEERGQLSEEGRARLAKLAREMEKIEQQTNQNRE
jgi:hypothetical protein